MNFFLKFTEHIVANKTLADGKKIEDIELDRLPVGERTQQKVPLKEIHINEEVDDLPVGERTEENKAPLKNIHINEEEVDDLLVGKRTQENNTPVKDIHMDEEVKEIQINEQKLREFLSKGELTVCHVRCIIVGCAGAGKTTLLRRLENITFEELNSIKTTEIVDVHVNSFVVLEDDETIQSKLFKYNVMN